jgi:hypothetical protein
VNLAEGTYEVSLTITVSNDPPWSGQVVSTTRVFDIVVIPEPFASFTFHDQLVDMPPVNIISVDGSASQNTVKWEWMLQHRVSAAEPFVTINTSGQLTVPTYDFVMPPLSGQFQIFLTAYNVIDETNQAIQLHSR